MRKRFDKQRVLFQSFDRKKYASRPSRAVQAFEGGELFLAPDSPESLRKRLNEGLLAFVLFTCALCWLGI